MAITPEQVVALNKVLRICEYESMSQSEIDFVGILNPSFDTDCDIARNCYNLLLRRYSQFSNVFTRLKSIKDYMDATNCTLTDKQKKDTKSDVNWVLGVTS